MPITVSIKVGASAALTWSCGCICVAHPVHTQDLTLICDKVVKNLKQKQAQKQTDLSVEMKGCLKRNLFPQNHCHFATSAFFF